MSSLSLSVRLPSLIRSPLTFPAVIEIQYLTSEAFKLETYLNICLFRLSKEAREMIDIGKIPVRSVSKNLDKMNADKSNTEKEKKRIARKKERRATLILGKV